MKPIEIPHERISEVPGILANSATTSVSPNVAEFAKIRNSATDS